MNFHFATIPVFGGTAPAEDDLNRFLTSHRVIGVERQLVEDGPRTAWAVCVTYVEQGGAADTTAKEPRKPSIDYREVLPPAQFEVFARLRALRKETAQREGVPPYALFTNEQLAEMVQRGIRSREGLATIDGVGPARLEKYGEAVLEVLRAAPAVA